MGMSCQNCVSQRVCKMWEQVDIIAERLISPPYASFTGGMKATHRRQVARKQDIQNLLGEITSRCCRLYVDKSVLQKT